VQVKLVPFRIDVFDLEDEVPRTAKGFSREVDGLAGSRRAFWLNTFYVDIGPVGIALPVGEVLPDHLDRGRDDGGRTH
jgi:hypothetical protein